MARAPAREHEQRSGGVCGAGRRQRADRTRTPASRGGSGGEGVTMTEGLYECPYYKSPPAEAVTLTWERWRTPLAKWLISRSEHRGTRIASR